MGFISSMTCQGQPPELIQWLYRHRFPMTSPCALWPLWRSAAWTEEKNELHVLITGFALMGCSYWNLWWLQWCSPALIQPGSCNSDCPLSSLWKCAWLISWQHLVCKPGLRRGNTVGIGVLCVTKTDSKTRWLLMRLMGRAKLILLKMLAWFSFQW